MLRKENILIVVVLGAILIWALFVNKPRHADTTGGTGVPSVTQTTITR